MEFVGEPEIITIIERVYVEVPRNVYIEVLRNVYITERVYVPRNVYITETERVYVTDTTVERVYIPQNIYIEPTPETIAEPDIEEVPPRLVLGQAVIDPTRRNYLVGFGDSLSGQNVPLRRSQAVIIIQLEKSPTICYNNPHGIQREIHNPSS